MAATLPAHATLKDISATFNERTIPRQFQAGPGLPPEIWGEVVVAEGEVTLKLRGATTRVMPEESALIPPGIPFGLHDAGKPVRFYLRYYHDPVLRDAAAIAHQLAQ